MPVKISATTNPLTGEITNSDCLNMKSDFDINVGLPRLNGTGSVIKQIAWYVTREEIEELFVKMTLNGTPPDMLEINFAVHLPNTTDICGNSIGDNITVVMEAKDKNKHPIGINEQYVIIPGYNTNTGKEITLKSLHGASCCPSSKPPTNP